MQPLTRQTNNNRDSHAGRGREAVAQARLALLVMINVAQLWILAATVEAALAQRSPALLPLVIASGICFVITLTIIFWWRPASRRFTSSGYLKR
jgi:Kef-type K+ transport system membrane component KefB